MVSWALHMVWATPPLRKSMDPPLVSLPYSAALSQLCFQPAAWRLTPILSDNPMGILVLMICTFVSYCCWSSATWEVAIRTSVNQIAMCTVF